MLYIINKCVYIYIKFSVIYIKIYNITCKNIIACLCIVNTHDLLNMQFLALVHTAPPFAETPNLRDITYRCGSRSE